jgi:hypothetical protein
LQCARVTSLLYCFPTSHSLVNAMATEYNATLDADDDDVNGDAAAANDDNETDDDDDDDGSSVGGDGGRGGRGNGVALRPRLAVGGCGWVRTPRERDEVFELFTEYAQRDGNDKRVLPPPAVSEYSLLSLPPPIAMANYDRFTIGEGGGDGGGDGGGGGRKGGDIGARGRSGGTDSRSDGDEGDSDAAARLKRRHERRQQQQRRRRDDALSHRMYVRVTGDTYRMCTQFGEVE